MIFFYQVRVVQRFIAGLVYYQTKVNDNGRLNLKWRAEPRRNAVGGETSSQSAAHRPQVPAIGWRSAGPTSPSLDVPGPDFWRQ
jgi:hypothetical protein